MHPLRCGVLNPTELRALNGKDLGNLLSHEAQLNVLDWCVCVCVCVCVFMYACIISCCTKQNCVQINSQESSELASDGEAGVLRCETRPPGLKANSAMCQLYHLGQSLNLCASVSLSGKWR